MVELTLGGRELVQVEIPRNGSLRQGLSPTTSTGLCNFPHSEALLALAVCTTQVGCNVAFGGGGSALRDAFQKSADSLSADSEPGVAEQGAKRDSRGQIDDRRCLV